MGVSNSFPRRLTDKVKGELRFAGPATTAFNICILGDRPSDAQLLVVAVDIIATSYRMYIRYIDALTHIMNHSGCWAFDKGNRVRRCAILRFTRTQRVNGNGSAHRLLVFCRSALVEFSSEERGLAARFLHIVNDADARADDGDLIPESALDDHHVNDLLTVLKGSYKVKSQQIPHHLPSHLMDLAKSIQANGLCNDGAQETLLSPPVPPDVKGDSKFAAAVLKEQRLTDIQRLRISGFAWLNPGCAPPGVPVDTNL